MWFLQANVFSTIADPKFGSVAIDYQQIPCSPPGNIIADVLNNIGPGGWVRFAIEVRVCECQSCAQQPFSHSSVPNSLSHTVGIDPLSLLTPMDRALACKLSTIFLALCKFPSGAFLHRFASLDEHKQAHYLQNCHPHPPP